MGEKESIKKLAKEKAEESGKKEALRAYFVGFLPFILLACMMAAIGFPTVIYTVVVVMAHFAGWVLYSSIKPEAVKRYYEKYLKEFAIIKGDDKGWQS